MAKHLLIVGLVQGVGYRASFEAQAQALKLSGWVRNRADGSVEALVHGEEAALEKVVSWARRGPPSAQVRDVTVTEMDDASVSSGRFDVLATK